jgi:hypothetical protein
MNTYNDAKVSMHHRLPGQSYQNVSSAKVADAANALWHDEFIPQLHDDAVLLTPRIGYIVAS